MKCAIVFVCLVAMAASMPTEKDRRFLESLLGGIDILDLAKQILSQFGSDETRAQCETTLCPKALESVITSISPLVEGLACGAICTEVKVLAQNLAPAPASP